MQEDQQRYGIWLRDQLRKSSTMEDHEIITTPRGWDNHEDSFEETLRREMLKWKEMYFILQEDHKRLTEDYYTVLKRVKELTEGK